MNERHHSGLTERIRHDGRQKLESGKRNAASHVEEVAHALDRARQQLNQNEPTLAAYTDQVAAAVGKFATRLRDDSLDDLLDETRRLARRNPALFLSGGIVLGIAAARFFKASADRAGENAEPASFEARSERDIATAEPMDTRGGGIEGLGSRHADSERRDTGIETPAPDGG